MKRIVLAACLLLGACEDHSIGATEIGAVGGAIAGAGLGAIIGHQSGHAGGGIAIGSGVGALGGALIGTQIDSQDNKIRQREQQLDAQQREIEENRRLLEELRERGMDVRQSDRGVVVNLPDVLFESGKSQLTSSARRTATEIAKVAQRAPSRRIAIEGHTDSVGSIEYNYHLSDERARSVALELEKNGLPRRVIATHAFGETEPIATNKTAEGRRRNRRVEVIIENESARR